MSKFLNEYQSKKKLQAYGLPTGDFTLATSQQQAVEAAEGYGYPVVMKIVSDQIIHKTEAKGIKLGIMNADEVKDAYDQLLANAKAYNANAVIDGILISPMVPNGTECIIGGLQDRQFGPVVMFGIGGVFVEIFKDIKFRMAPIDEAEALRMIRSIKGFPMLDGARGRTPVNLKELSSIVSAVSHYLAEHPEVQELDINPIICYEDQVQILDASIGLTE
ncbi:acetate--CoA ligase family protein [Hydrogenoanaerobacterium sp.]|uniref:acetate--CoA ligase family protein n=1 Tax=Hydrogenoanaerobacterium sp. TaxID=2953763 RepID=UPI002897B4CE|nr:acetate--CoA ligase family protein [Hydrogenoanaerobacterium sp.]